MTTATSPRAAWRTSSYSGANGDCVEVARPAPGVIAVRDSTDPGGSRLAFPSGPWTAFTAALKKQAVGQTR
jgi:Domain of unknown function (DUF397)